MYLSVLNVTAPIVWYWITFLSTNSLLILKPLNRPTTGKAPAWVRCISDPHVILSYSAFRSTPLLLTTLGRRLKCCAKSEIKTGGPRRITDMVQPLAIIEYDTLGANHWRRLGVSRWGYGGWWSDFVLFTRYLLEFRCTTTHIAATALGDVLRHEFTQRQETYLLVWKSS